MKPVAAAVKTLPVREPERKPALPFPVEGRRPAQLRRLRERLFREGKVDLALQAAAEVVRLDPGRESTFRLGFLQRESGRYREALKTLRDALRFESGPKYVLPEIHLHLAYTWFLMGKRKRMGESLRRAYALRPKPRTAFNFHMTLGNDHLAHKRYREALAEFERAEAAARSGIARGRATINQGVALIRLRRLGDARRPLDRALRVLKRGGHKAELATARTIRASVYVDLGQLRRALGMFLRAARTFRQLGKPDREAEILSNAAYIAGEMGLWPRSLALLDRAIRQASVLDRPDILALAYACRASAYAYNEEFDKASEDMALCERQIRGRRDWIGVLHLCRTRARVAAMVGRWREVRSVARRAERVAAKAGDLPRVVEFRKMRAEAEAKLGRNRASLYARKGASRLEALLGAATPKMRELSRVATHLAATELPILIVGESGTGKVELAREIHKASPRAKGPCVVVPCEQLVFPASDLEGHEQGAWSGADRASGGLVTQAVGGTLILDRVDQLSLEGQRALVRVVEGRTRPVGRTQEREVDLRIVATCRDVGKLLPDLRSRLQGAVLPIPPLRDRREEIARLVQERLGRRTITPDALAALASRPWEGNLPELRGVVDRLAALAKGVIGRNLVLSVLKSPETRRVRAPVYKRRSSLEPALATV